MAKVSKLNQGESQGRAKPLFDCFKTFCEVSTSVLSTETESFFLFLVIWQLDKDQIVWHDKSISTQSGFSHFLVTPRRLKPSATNLPPMENQSIVFCFVGILRGQATLPFSLTLPPRKPEAPILIGSLTSQYLEPFGEYYQCLYDLHAGG